MIKKYKDKHFWPNMGRGIITTLKYGAAIGGMLVGHQIGGVAGELVKSGAHDTGHSMHSSETDDEKTPLERWSEERDYLLRFVVSNPKRILSLQSDLESTKALLADPKDEIYIGLSIGVAIVVMVSLIKLIAVA